MQIEDILKVWPRIRFLFTAAEKRWTINPENVKCEILGDTEAFQYSGYLHFQMYLERWDHLTYSLQALPQNHIYGGIWEITHPCSPCTNLDGFEPDRKSHGKHGPFLEMREMTAFLSVRSVLIQMSACVGKSYFVEDLNCDIRLLTSFVWHLDSTDRWWPQSLSWSTTSKQTQNQTTKKHTNW